MHGAARDGQSDGFRCLLGGPGTGRREHLGGVRQTLGGEGIGQPWLHRPPSRRQRPWVTQPQDPVHAGARAPQEGQWLFDALRREVPATTDRATEDREEADRHEKERPDADELAPTELTPAEVVLEGGDADADAGGDGQGSRGEHHCLGRREGPQVATRCGEGDPPRGQRGEPQACRPSQPGAASDGERQCGARHQQPGQGRTGHRPDGETDDFAPARRRGRRKREAEDRHRPLARQDGAHDPRERQDQGHDDRLHGHNQHVPRPFAETDEQRAQHPRHRGNQDHGHDRRCKARGERNHGAESRDLAGGPRPPTPSGLHA